MHRDDAVDLAVVDVRQRDVVAEQERKARVVVLEVQRFAHAGRKLVDEAENAFVAAGALLIHQIRLELEAERAVLRLDDLFFVDARAVRLFKDKRQVRVRLVKAEIEDVADRMAVDRDERIPFFHPGALRQAVRLHAENFDRQEIHLRSPQARRTRREQ